MKAEKMVMLTGKQYQEIKQELDRQSSFKYNVGTNSKPEYLNITDIYLDTDPEFTRNPKQYAEVSNDNYVQVKVEYED
jgi:heat shock protein HspQ